MTVRLNVAEMIRDDWGIWPCPVPVMFAKRSRPMTSLFTGPERVVQLQLVAEPAVAVGERCWMIVSWVPV